MTHRLSAWFYITGLIVANTVGLMAFGTVLYQYFVGRVVVSHMENAIAALVGFVIFNWAVFLTFVYDAWESLAPFHPRLTPERAVWGHFIPLYNFYHICIAIVCLADETNRARAERGIPEAPRLRRIAIIFVVLWILSCVLPVVAVFALVAQIMFILKICAAINAVAPPDHPIGTKPPLMRWSWWLVLAVFAADFVPEIGFTWVMGPSIHPDWRIKFGAYTISIVLSVAAYWFFFHQRNSKPVLIRIGVFALCWIFFNLGVQSVYDLLDQATDEFGYEYLAYVYIGIPLLHIVLISMLFHFGLRLPLMLLIAVQTLAACGWLLVFDILQVDIAESYSFERRILGMSIAVFLTTLFFLFPLYHGTRKARWDSWRTSSAA